MAMASMWSMRSVNISSGSPLHQCSSVTSHQGLFTTHTFPAAATSTSRSSSQLRTTRRRRLGHGIGDPCPCCMSAELNSENSVDSTTLDDSLSLDPRKGKYECRSCGHVYDQSVGDPTYPIAAGLEFQKLPDDWRCPTCGAAKSYFNSLSVEVAGFAQNQNYGLGTNTLTSGQKSILIYGSLILAFILFLSGYFLQ
ncbi:hypothetical protein O6H91_04G074600 [Diphasiastrum complanatum]|uniref:Uncharacterized protein n=1 Tax=Diphasiastrum complanatum TaxID=34168 RepID=A0ACC2DYQ0_DIPCM|nr:hypothetical protein O6H91_04G074600 [Diphasiastrum complanatum]